MSEHAERPIEKLVRAAAQRRRDEAGSPTMHPATREILHTEAGRRYRAGKSAAARRTRGWFSLVPRLAVFLVLCASAWFLFVREDEESESTLARLEKSSTTPGNRSEQISSTMEAAAITPEPAVAPAAEPVMMQPVARSPQMGAGQARPRSDVSAPVERTEGSVVGADYFKADRQAMYVGTAVTKKDQEDLRSAQPAGGYMLEDAETTTPRGVITLSAAPAPSTFKLPLSQRFTLVNEGLSLRFIDADGSTYFGTLQSVETPSGEADAARTAREADSVAALEARDSAVSEELVPVSFKVIASGTNRTLGRTVEFEGDLELTQQQMELGRNVFSNTIVPTSADRARVAIPAASRAFPGRLEGNVTLGDGTLLRVEAVPTR